MQKAGTNLSWSGQSEPEDRHVKSSKTKRPLKESMKFVRRAAKLGLSGDIDGLEREITKSALDYGISGNVIGRAIRLRRIASTPISYLRQKAEANRISATSPYAHFIDAGSGYRLFSSQDLPDVAAAVETADRFFNQKKSEQREQGSKPFFSNICDEADLARYPDLLTFARSQPVFDMAASYLEAMPKLSAFGVFYSPPNDSLEKSQMWHIDDEDFCQIKCFINLHDVGPENGPFTFIPAQKSDEIRRKLRHGWRGKRLEDSDIMAHCKPEDIISLTGKPGTGAFVDTSRCLHFGSRARGGHRLVMMFQYTRTPDLNFVNRETRKSRSILLQDH
jgi:hypothetical protein